MNSTASLRPPDSLTWELTHLTRVSNRSFVPATVVWSAADVPQVFSCVKTANLIVLADTPGALPLFAPGTDFVVLTALDFAELVATYEASTVTRTAPVTAATRTA